MTLFGASVPRRKRTVFTAPPGGSEEEPATKNGDGSSGADGSAVSAPSFPVPTADDGSMAAAAAQLKFEEERKRKGKMLAADQILKDAPLLQPPVHPKLMGDAIRAHPPVDTRAPKAKASKKRKRLGHVFSAGMPRDGQSTSSAGSNHTEACLDKIDVVDDSLRRTLRELGVSPVRIYGKRLSKSDRLKNQHRLLMSCKGWENKQGVPFPLDQTLTAEEKPLVNVQAYDRRGQPFVVLCKKLTTNNAYRLITGWGEFLINNGLVVEQDAKPEEVELAMVELWAFRSPLLKVGVHNQPGGPLGLVVVHYRKGESPHADAAIAEMLAAGSRAAVPRWVDHVQDEAAPVHEEVVPVLGGAVQVHEDAVPLLGDAVHIHEDAVAALGDAVHVHEDAVPVLGAVHFHEDAVPALGDAAVHAHDEGAVPIFEDAVDDETDEKMVEAAEALMLLYVLLKKIDSS